MFCIKSLKPLLRNVVRLPHFDHADTFTFVVILNLLWARLKIPEKVVHVTI